MNLSPSSVPRSLLPPEPWSTPEIVEDVVVTDDVSIHRAGISTISPDGEEICGSAAERSGSALHRARFELLERACTAEAMRRRRPVYVLRDASEQPVGQCSAEQVFPESDEPSRWRFARTNGIALHSDWTMACRRALWELAERDRILRSWYGDIAPLRMDISPDAMPRTQNYAWQAYSFPSSDEETFSRGIEVVGVFGFPTRDQHPFLLGFAARPEANDAFEAAVAEALQMLAFLWGEPVPTEAPALEPTAMFHLDLFQVKGKHESVRRWLEGAHLAHARAKASCSDASKVVGFVDLTSDWLQDGLRVAKAICSDAIPLVFGDSPFARHLPPELRVHPIP